MTKITPSICKFVLSVIVKNTICTLRKYFKALSREDILYWVKMFCHFNLYYFAAVAIHRSSGELLFLSGEIFEMDLWCGQCNIMNLEGAGHSFNYYSLAQVCTVMTSDNCESILDALVLWSGLSEWLRSRGLLPAQAGSGMSGAEKAGAGELLSRGWTLVCAGLRTRAAKLYKPGLRLDPHHFSSTCHRGK